MAYLQLIRFQNLCLLALTQLVLYFGLGEASDRAALLLLLLGTSLVAARGYMLNDWFDQATDRINRPERPLVAQKLSVRGFWMSYLLLGLLLLVLSFFTPPAIYISWLVAELLLWVYGRWSKQLPGLLANALVAFLSAWSVVLVGFLLPAFPLQLWFFAAFAFGLHLMRELVKDLEDQEGDRQIGARTLPLVWGQETALSWLGISLVFCISGLAIWGFWAERLVLRLLLLLIAAQLVFLFFAPKRHQQDFRRTSTHLKAVMLQGLCLVFF